MRLITLSLFAFLLAVSAFGQTEESAFDPTLGTVQVRGGSSVCSGVLLNRSWVLTVADCFRRFDPYLPEPVHASANPPQARLLLSPYKTTLRGGALALRVVQIADVAMVQSACQTPYDSGFHKAVARLSYEQFNSGASFAAEVVPWGYATNPRITGNAFKGDRIWTVQGMDAELPSAANGAPLYVNEQLVGLHSRKLTADADGVATFVDVSFSNTELWQAIYRTIQRETLVIPELCGSNRLDW